MPRAVTFLGRFFVVCADECIAEFGDEFEQLLGLIGMDEANAAASATAATTQLASLVVGFSTWGCEHRVPGLCPRIAKS